MWGSNHKQVLKPLAIVLLLAVITTTSGCLWAPNLVRIRKDIERQLPGVRFEKEIELTLGPLALVFARFVTGIVPPARVASGCLNGVSRIELAVYNTVEMPSVKAVTMPERLRELRESEDWELAVKVRNDRELVWIFYRIDGDTIRELYTVVLSDEELVLVKVQGNLKKLVGYAIGESGALKGLHGI
jgi:hypothetical protein